MYKAMAGREVLTKSLFSNDTAINAELGAVPTGDFGPVYRGELHKGQQVALKVLERGHNDVSDSALQTTNDTQFDQNRPALPSLLRILRFAVGNFRSVIDFMLMTASKMQIARR